MEDYEDICMELKTGEYDGVTIMKARITIQEFKKELDEVKKENESLKLSIKDAAKCINDWNLKFIALEKNKNKVRADAVRKAKQITVLSYNSTNKFYEAGFDDGIEAYDKQNLENRYLVIKFNDINKYLTPDEKESLFFHAKTIDIYRKETGKSPIEAIVIESDWPEYKAACSMLEERINNE